MKCKKLVLILVAVLIFSLLLATPIMAAGVFTKYILNPVVKNNNTWDSELAGAACVILDGNTYKMWYTGKGDAPGRGGNKFHICYAESADGLSWNEVVTPNPVFWGNYGWETTGVASPYVIKENPVSYKMWYTGINGFQTQIGYATSLDGINWSEPQALPVLQFGAGGVWDQYGVALPSVIQESPTSYKMWYTGIGGASLSDINGIGFATSTDGIVWSGGNPPVLTKSLNAADFDGDAVLACSVIKVGLNYSMYYTGLTNGGGGRLASIGEAFSTDGIGLSWTKAGSSPLLDIGSAGSWDEKGVAAPSVLIGVGGTVKMWYTGSNNNMVFQIGYAEWIPEHVPASSNISTGLLIGGIAVLMVAIFWWARRYQIRNR
jgi:beta-1,2-mannobiose phosphorylase / 1,2-beta-oligomannan phosphorylase